MEIEPMTAPDVQNATDGYAVDIGDSLAQWATRRQKRVQVLALIAVLVVALFAYLSSGSLELGAVAFWVGFTLLTSKEAVNSFRVARWLVCRDPDDYRSRANAYLYRAVGLCGVGTTVFALAMPIRGSVPNAKSRARACDVVSSEGRRNHARSRNDWSLRPSK